MVQDFKPAEVTLQRQTFREGITGATVRELLALSSSEFPDPGLWLWGAGSIQVSLIQSTRYEREPILSEHGLLMLL